MSQKLYEELASAEKAYAAAANCGCVCHVTKVGHEKVCCYANQTLTSEIKEDIARIHADIRRGENGRVG